MTDLNDKLRELKNVIDDALFYEKGDNTGEYCNAVFAFQKVATVEVVSDLIAEIGRLRATQALQAAPSAEKLRQAYLNGLLMAAQVCDAKLKERAATGHAREASTARALAEEIRGFAADAPVPLTQAAPTDAHMYEDRPADDLAQAGEAFERDVYAILKGASPKRIDEPADVIAARASTCTDISSMTQVSNRMNREEISETVKGVFRGGALVSGEEHQLERARFEQWVKEDRIPPGRRDAHWRTWQRAIYGVDQSPRRAQQFIAPKQPE